MRAAHATDEYTFLGFDCAYRTLGWCVLGYNPRGAILCPQTLAPRDVLALRAGGVEDVLGAPIENIAETERARRLAATVARICAGIDIARAIVVIERQPRKCRARRGVHDTNQTIEAQLVLYFSAIAPARAVHLISGSKKNALAQIILHEPRVATYAERKKQARRAYVHLATLFNFDAHPEARNYRRVRPDRADACVQIVATIFLCARNIEYAPT